MAMICFSVTIATAGTPQQLLDPSAQIVMGGTTFPAGSATLRGYQLMLQASPGNTAGKTVYVGNKGMVVSTKVKCGIALPTGAVPVSLGQYGGLQDLSDLWIDTDAGTNGTETLLVTVVG